MKSTAPPIFALRRLMLPLLGFALVMVGCTGVQQPRVDVRSPQLLQTTQDGGRMSVTLELTNPNAEPLSLPRAFYALSVEGLGTYRFEGKPNAALPPRGSQQVSFAGAIAAAPAEWQGRRYRVNGRIEFEPPGQIREMLTESGVPLPSITFEQEGELESASDAASN